MQITDVRIKLAAGEPDRLVAYASLLFDGSFVVRDIRLIEGPSRLFASMPSRRNARRCPSCGSKNHTTARFCNDCGNPQPAPDPGLPRFTDIAHPVTQTFRNVMHDRLSDEYNKEKELAKRPDYVCRFHSQE